MTENEKELVEMIRNSNDPAKAMVIAVDVIVDFLLDLKKQAAPLVKCEQKH